ncbi:B12-binding domain-containing radical SAM protein [Paenibacillus wynnii]|uniref:Uncharacterized protein n=1 Tax=Paenibacillus wynnii TaxID=268407 RepID=A0A098MB27_9BACL|nr:radical SAM protein [Paenibacillus wynnii]KGE19749.1 hypothetical protein PWYN_10660 [Paenibacillus wynnii]
MKVLLLHPAYKSYKLTEPLGLCYIASALRNRGFSVDLVDPRIQGTGLEETVASLLPSLHDYGMIGITASDYYHKELRDTIHLMRKGGAWGHITVGGYGPTTNWRVFLGLGADSAVIGEGEVTFLELAEKLCSGTDWRSIPGIACTNSDGHQVKTAQRQLIGNLDSLPFPSREIYQSFSEKYSKKYISPQIQGSRGCYMHCSFCSTPDYLKEQGGQVYRTRSVQSIVDEIQRLTDRFQVTDFEFVDDNFFPPDRKEALRRAQALRDELAVRGLNITFFMQFRPEYVSLPLLQTLKEAGMTRMFMGIESVNDRDLQLYGRNYTGAEVEETIQSVLASGYTTDFQSRHRFRYGYINFHPLSRLDSLKVSGEAFERYNFTYKKLVKRLELFDNNRQIYLKIIAQFPEFSGKRYFKDPQVALFHHWLSRYYQLYTLERDKYRVIEKAVMKGDLAYSDLEWVTDQRRYYDSQAYHCYRKGLEICGEASYEMQLKQFFREEIHGLELRIKESRAQLRETNVGLEQDAFDVFF